jgi:hypothetical protein
VRVQQPHSGDSIEMYVRGWTLDPRLLSTSRGCQIVSRTCSHAREGLEWRGAAAIHVHHSAAQRLLQLFVTRKRKLDTVVRSNY